METSRIFTLIIVCSTYALAALATLSDVTEKCQWEDFTASCGGDVIVMSDALYGRMDRGRCVETSFGFLGCKTNVLPELDRECSGRTDCQFAVTTLHGDHNCPNDLTAYLAAAYTCVKVTPCIQQVCQSSERLTLTDPSGVLASATTSEKGCGSHTCPWYIQAKPGQRINVTLMDFGHKTRRESPHDKNVCRKFATLSEGGRTKDITACGGHHTREKLVYVSKAPELQIQMFARQDAAKNPDPAFLIVYEVTGCPDIVASAHARVTRTEDEAEVRCTQSGGVWHLTCRGTSWVGEIGACQDAETSAVRYGGIFGTSRTSPVGMIVVIGLGVALGVAIGVTLLLIALAYMKRKSRRRTVNENGCPLVIEGSRLHPDHPSKLDSAFLESCPFSRREDGTYGPDNSYTSTLCIRRPLPEEGGQGMGAADRLDDDVLMTYCPDMLHPSIVAYNEPAETISKEHVYETPNFPLQPSVPGHVIDTAQSTDGLFNDGPGRPFNDGPGRPFNDGPGRPFNDISSRTN